MPKHRAGGAGGAGPKPKPKPKVKAAAARAVRPAASGKPAGGVAAAADGAAGAATLQRALPFAEQQRLLNVFSDALAPTLASRHLPAALQAVKQALFARDFAGAFGGGEPSSASPANPASPAIPATPATPSDVPPLLDAYAARWSPTRALCYAAILSSPLVQAHWRQPQTTDSSPTGAAAAAVRMVAVGGGAAETVAFVAALAEEEEEGGLHGDLVLVDSGPWASVVGKLCGALTGTAGDGTPMTTTATTKQLPLIQPADRLAVDVRQLDILQVEDAAMADLLMSTSTSTTTLVTLFFTLNELFTAGGVGATATCLLRLTAAAAAGTLLLVVDSPGSYAETTVGTQARRYPMRWLLDKILLGEGEGEVAAWTKLHQDDAVWCRLPASLVYPIRLEDMRYQVHLYVRR